jgi:hypothetical protein
MSQLLVTMTHEDLPGVEREASLNAYRYAWYPEGWRSADDPSWTGQGSEAPTPHVGDNSLHGGGTEIDYAEITSNASGVAVSALSYAAVPGLVLNVPSGLLRPVYLQGHVRMVSSTASSTVAATFAPVGSSNLADGRGIAYQTTRATSDPVTSAPFLRLPAGTGGDWQIYVAATGSVTITVQASTQGVSSCRAFTA